jgi:hypothetical protein
METNGLAAVMDRFTNDETFREEMKNDPEGAIQRGGFDLDASEWDTVKNMDWSLPGEDLDDRVNKSGLLPNV